jgi:murein DD-endopeptidase MepM/ murein hydrolase activator NlpD
MASDRPLPAQKEALAAEREAGALDRGAGALTPGEVVLLRIGAELETLEIRAFGRSFPAFREHGSWNALVGVDLNTKPGPHTLHLEGTLPGGEKISGSDTLTVRARSFPTRHLKVEPKYVTPPAEVLARIERESAEVEAVFRLLSPTRRWQGAFEKPVPGEVISVFGKRPVYNGQPRKPHTGVDLKGKTGTPVAAPNAGRVAMASDLYYSGLTVVLDHGLGVCSYLAHLSEMSVEVGDVVKKGDLVGKVGATGRVTGPHLHWTVTLSGARVDPMSLVDVTR